jgi:molecular chaperone DnaJ
MLGNMRTSATCSTCHGRGQSPEKKCKHCNGAGVMQKESEVKIKIPAGVSDGEVVRVSGYGEAVQGGATGDLYVRVHVKEDKNFERSGADLYTDLTLSFPQAALGDTVEVKTVDASVKLNIPSGTQPGQVIRAKGYGLPHLNKPSTRGDLYVRVILEVPKHLNRKQKKALEEFRDAE